MLANSVIRRGKQTFVALAVLMGMAHQVSAAQNLRRETQLPPPPVVDPNKQRVGDYIVAVVNNEPITRAELRARLYRIELQLLQAGAVLPEREELQKQLLQKMIDDRVQVQEAREMGLRIDESAVQQAIQNMASQNNMTDVQLLDKLRADGVSIAQLRNDLRDELLLDRIREVQSQRVNVSESELDQFIAEQQARANDPRQEKVNIAQILVAVPEGAGPQKTEELRRKAQEIARRALKEDFAKLVTVSDAQRANGGAMGLRPQEEYPEIFVRTVSSMRVGQVSEPVKSEAGFHILKLLERSKPQLDDTIVQTQVRHIILRPDETLTQEEAIEKLRAVKAAIMAGKVTFAAAAQELSQDGSAARGGDLGWVNPGQFVPEFEEVMNSTPANRITDPIVSRYGVHVLEVLGRKRITVGYTQQRELARKALRQKKGEEALKRWAEEVRGRAFIELRPAPTL